MFFSIITFLNFAALKKGGYAVTPAENHGIEEVLPATLQDGGRRIRPDVLQGPHRRAR
jgi:hypothetical protein